ncbi:MAG: glycosyltransferase family 4 protein, partial [Lentisphaeria bacterium]|nr:glycosyltransferase family 4 protein [Lentisphaeria bacterium]
ELDRFLNAEREKDLRRELGIPEEAKVVGTVARLFPLKGYEELMKVIPPLAATRQNLYFLFVGNGSMMEEIRQWAAAQGLAERIRFAGLVPPHEVCRYVAQMDLLVHFSLREGLPRAAVQALAEAKPVVAYPLDGTPEVVIDGVTGFLPQPGDLAAMERAIGELLDDDAKRIAFGKAGQDLVREKFPWQVMSDTLVSAYQNLLS